MTADIVRYLTAQSKNWAEVDSLSKNLCGSPGGSIVLCAVRVPADITYSLRRQHNGAGLISRLNCICRARQLYMTRPTYRLGFYPDTDVLSHSTINGVAEDVKVGYHFRLTGRNQDRLKGHGGAPRLLEIVGRQNFRTPDRQQLDGGAAGECEAGVTLKGRALESLNQRDAEQDGQSYSSGENGERDHGVSSI
jgi:hypothetical protein